MKRKLKIIAMIPARMGSKRVKFKNLRLLAGKPLIHHVLGVVRDAAIFDEIYLNSEDEIFADVAREFGAQFYRRPEELAGDNATNDQFVNDFLTNVECDYLVQVNPTSPLFTVEDIRKFTTMMIDGNYDALHGVKEERIEGILEGKPLNFDPCKPMPRSQDLSPILLHAGGIMGWKRSEHLRNMKEFGCATYGCEGKIGYFKIEGFSQIDIDREEDFMMAELAMQVRQNPDKFSPQFPEFLKEQFTV